MWARVWTLLLCLSFVFLSACAEIPAARVGEAAESETSLLAETEMPASEDTGDGEQEEITNQSSEESPPIETETPPSEDVSEVTETDQLSDEDLLDAGFGEILLYAISDEIFQLPRTQVPYYEAGDVVFKTEAFFQQQEKGDEAWRSDPLRVAFVLCRNLLGNQQDVLCADETASGGELTTKAGLKIQVTPPIDGALDHPYTAEMIAPGLGRYRITMEYMVGTSVLYIRKIVFLPRISEDTPYEDILIYSLSDDTFFDRPRTEVPEYSGELEFNTEEFFQSHREGHQPWRGHALKIVEVLCWNLLGDRVQPLCSYEGYIETIDRVERKSGLVIQTIKQETYIGTVEMTVPSLGKYLFEVGGRDDMPVVYVRTITFTPD
jgi:hypothetical protein